MLASTRSTMKFFAPYDKTSLRSKRKEAYPLLFRPTKQPLTNTSASRKAPSNSTQMRRPWSLCGTSNSRRYQPTLVSGKRRPSGLYPCERNWLSADPLSSCSNGSSTAQSCGRSSERHLESSKPAFAILKSPVLEKSLCPKPNPRSFEGSVECPNVNFQPKSNRSCSRGAIATSDGLEISSSSLPGNSTLWSNLVCASNEEADRATPEAISSRRVNAVISNLH